ncbi:MAG: hypothetical protein KZQ99_04095 [Candidatus Thiodiazotropha sp. (ex Dulcina madagascariensis)]|nr:hypothetical protein [Candidatus Thiodiazotropha sp. (ex Dulcina madagascariensis)]
MMTTKQKAPAPCSEVPEFERLNYFYGQMLSVSDFRSEQDYFREKLKLHNRCHHGWGVVCGLQVAPIEAENPCPPDDCDDWQKLCEEIKALDAEIAATEALIGSNALSEEELQKAKQKLQELHEQRERLQRRQECTPPSQRPRGDKPGDVLIHCGIALDCCGNELIVRQPIVVDLSKMLGAGEIRRCEEQGDPVDVYLSLCFCEQPTFPSRPVIPDSCGSLSECNYGKYRESTGIRVSLEAPSSDDSCGGCCESCQEACVVLARIRWQPGADVTAEAIECGIRRPLSLYPPTVITGISWQHGALYTPNTAKTLLGTEFQGSRTDGLEIHFSRPVYTETLKPGVIDLWRIQGGSGLRGVISNMEGSFVGLSGDKTDKVFFRDDTGETLNSGDRVLITIRCNFILDGCCQPVDGFHVGGRVPQLPDYMGKFENGNLQQPEHCLIPPGGCAPWRSGNRQPGGSFESWFYVK